MCAEILAVSLATWLVRGIVAIAVLVSLSLTAYVRLTTRSHRFVELDRVPSRPVAVVFGAGVWEDGSPTPVLADRVFAGVDLYQQGKVSHLLMSGDNQSPDYNEVDAMRQLAEDSGVPPEAILLDRLGLSTYETCWRARQQYNIDAAILVTQRYHLPRAVYIARGLGIDAVGYGVPDWGVYMNRSMLSYSLREIPATAKAIVEIFSEATAVERR